jgi:hypothetical protein
VHLLGGAIQANTWIQNCSTWGSEDQTVSYSIHSSPHTSACLSCIVTAYATGTVPRSEPESP